MSQGSATIRYRGRGGLHARGRGGRTWSELAKVRHDSWGQVSDSWGDVQETGFEPVPSTPTLSDPINDTLTANDVSIENADGTSSSGDAAFYKADRTNGSVQSEGTYNLITKEDEPIILTDPTIEVIVDKNVTITCNGSTILVSAGYAIAALREELPVHINIITPGTTLTTRMKKTPVKDSEDEASGPYDLKKYDESRYEKGAKFHYEGDYLRGEGESVVLVNSFLREYMQGIFDDNEDVNDELWDSPAKMAVANLIAPLVIMEEEIESRKGEERKALRELVTYVRRRNAAALRTIEELKSDSRVSFAVLDKIFSVGNKVTFSLDGAVHGAIVDRIRLEHGMFSKWYDIKLRYIGTNGKRFCIETSSMSIPFFGGSKPFKSLPLQPLVERSDLWEELSARGNKFVEHAIGHHYLAYDGAGIDNSRWRRLIRASGRIMLDATSFDFMNPDAARRLDDSTLFDTVPPKDFVICSPFLRGFSFFAKKWLTFKLEATSSIAFDENAFEGLVLDTDVKETIESLVTSFDATASLDFISAKSEALIFNLAGPPGVGKTLTCEAVAEKLHLPLYSVTVGELGSTLEDLEVNLQNLLEIAARWNAITLIDEADIFMQKRTDLDVVRNGFVGIFLRLLEYHRGLLFLTTNRVEAFDDAFKSRISMSIAYPHLDEAARQQIWTTFLARTKTPHNLDVSQLGKLHMNGREIRSLIRLILALAMQDRAGTGIIEQRHLEKVLKVQQYRFVVDNDEDEDDDDQIELATFDVTTLGREVVRVRERDM